MTWIVVVALAVAILAGVFLAPTSDDDPWASIRKRVASLKDEANARNLSRPVLRGEPVPGDAWDEYSIALNDVLAFSDDGLTTNLVKFHSRDPQADRAMVDRLLAAHKGALDHVRLGAQRTNGQYPYDWERGINSPARPKLLAIRRLVMLGVAQTRIWTEEGRAQDAANLLLDLSQFNADVATNGPLLSNLIGIGTYSITLDEMRHLLLSGKLDQKALVDLGKKLEIMDENFPALGPTVINEMMMCAISFEESDSDRLDTKLKQLPHDGWRYGFSFQRMAIEAVERNDAFAQRFRLIDQLHFTAARRGTEEIRAEAATSGNPLLRQAMPELTRILTKEREVLARLRLLRAATAFLATGKTPQLMDPLGGNLSYSLAGGKLKIWSLGSDGESQNGRGSWKSVPGEDFVLEISR
jgi:hypothetical protein